MRLNLSQIESRVEEIAQIIGATRESLPTFGHSEQDGRPHIEVDARGYHYVIAERGHEFQRHTTTDIDELLYKVFQGVTFELAGRYELKHRVQEQDFRRVLFSYQEELLSQLAPSWGERRKREHEQILEQYPFDDEVYHRVTYFKELGEQGNPPDIAWKMAREKYPLPEKIEK
jgi:hypothetical protein